MMRLIDADKLKDIKFHGEENLFEMGWNYAIDAIVENAPTIDAVKVVRCKDCKHMKHVLDKGKNGICGALGALIIMSGNDYCSYGERKEDNER